MGHISCSPESSNTVDVFNLSLVICNAFGETTYLNWGKWELGLLALGTFHALLLAFLHQGFFDAFGRVLLGKLLHTDLTVLLD